jgi:hypothetical protein
MEEWFQVNYFSFSANKIPETEQPGKTISLFLLRRVKKLTAAGVYLPDGRHPIIPIFQHSIIPVVSAANLSSD